MAATMLAPATQMPSAREGKWGHPVERAGWPETRVRRLRGTSAGSGTQQAEQPAWPEDFRARRHAPVAQFAIGGHDHAPPGRLAHHGHDRVVSRAARLND